MKPFTTYKTNTTQNTTDDQVLRDILLSKANEYIDKYNSHEGVSWVTPQIANGINVDELTLDVVYTLDPIDDDTNLLLEENFHNGKRLFQFVVANNVLTCPQFTKPLGRITFQGVVNKRNEIELASLRIMCKFSDESFIKKNYHYKRDPIINLVLLSDISDRSVEDEW